MSSARAQLALMLWRSRPSELSVSGERLAAAHRHMRMGMHRQADMRMHAASVEASARTATCLGWPPLAASWK